MVHRVNWVYGSHGSWVTGSLGHKMWPSSMSAADRPRQHIGGRCIKCRHTNQSINQSVIRWHFTVVSRWRYQWRNEYLNRQVSKTLEGGNDDRLSTMYDRMQRGGAKRVDQEARPAKLGRGGSQCIWPQNWSIFWDISAAKPQVVVVLRSRFVLLLDILR